jgi:hypothetical protein
MQVSIIGKGRTWNEAPFGGECWGITQLILRRPVDLVIDMNVYEDGRWGEQEQQEAIRVVEICKDRGIPYVCLENYPIEEVVRKFKTDYFSSTVDYSIALAIHRGYTDIDLYGVTMDGTSDYYKIKCGCDFWCGYAKGRGVNVTTHGTTTVMRTQDGLVYGYDVKQGTLLERWGRG